MSQAACKDCEKIENVKEILKTHAEQIETNRADIAEIKAEDKETKLYVKMILEKIDYLTMGFDNLKQEREKEITEKMKLLETSKKWEYQTIGQLLPDILRFLFKLILLSIVLLGSMKAATLLDLLKLLK